MCRPKISSIAGYDVRLQDTPTGSHDTSTDAKIPVSQDMTTDCMICQPDARYDNRSKFWKGK